ncbi:MAG: vWA domain-containing protein [Bacteroidota bacterium]
MRLLPLALLALLLAPSGAAQRAVAVVYDDSGSMLHRDEGENGGPWAYANYALQTLAALLRDSDALHVVTMHAPDTPLRFPLGGGSAGRQALVDSLNGQPVYNFAGNTPYQSLATAQDVLAQAPQPEKWLVVLTDGAFEDTPEAASMQAQAESFVRATGARVVFLLIGEDAKEVDALAQQPAVAVWTDVQGQVYRALSSADVADRMNEIAALITARTLGGQPDVRLAGDQLVFDSEFPLRRLTLVQQDASRAALAALRRATHDRGALPFDSTLTTRVPRLAPYALFGNVTQVRPTNAGGLIEPGEIQLAFDRAVQPGEVLLLPEAAVDLAVEVVSAKGYPVETDGAVLRPCVGDTMRVRATLLGPPDGQGFRDTLVANIRRPDRIAMQARFGSAAEAMRVNPQRSAFRFDFAAPDTALAISVAATYPGYFDLRSPVYTVAAAPCIPRTLALGDDGPWRAPVTDFDDRAPLTVWPIADGARVDAFEFDEWTLRLVDDDDLTVDLAKGDQGWTLRPRPRYGLAAFTPQRTYEVVVEAQSPGRGEAAFRTTLRFEVEPVPWWTLWGPYVIVLGVLLFLLWYLWGIIKKPRFCRGARIVFQERSALVTGKERTYSLPTGWANRWLVPYRAERKTIRGVLFQAGSRCNHLVLPEDAQSDAMVIEGARVDDPGRRPLRLVDGTVLEVDRGSRRQRYTYVAG